MVTALVVMIAGQGCARPPREQAPAPGGKAPAAKVGPTTERRSAPTVAQKLGVTFGKELELVGFNISPSPVIKGEPATLEIVWKCLSEPSRNWTVWTHLDYQGTPAKRINKDHYLRAPMTMWEPGKYYRDKVQFTIPASDKPGKYRVSIGVYFQPSKKAALQYLPEKLSKDGNRYGTFEV
jgi:hypothetical protein